METNEQHEKHEGQPNEEVFLTFEKIFEEGRALHDAEDYEGALALYRDALSMQESRFGLYHECTGKTYWNMGWCSYLLDQKQKEDEGNRIDYKQIALSFFQMAWKIARKMYDNYEDEATTAFVLNDIQEVLYNNGEGLSIPSIQKYFYMMDKILEVENEGDEYNGYQCRHRALQLYEKALHLQDKLLTAHKLYNVSWQQQGRQDDISYNLESAHLQCKLASILKRNRHLHHALIQLHMALTVYESILGKKHPSTIKTSQEIDQISMILSEESTATMEANIQSIGFVNQKENITISNKNPPNKKEVMTTNYDTETTNSMTNDDYDYYESIDSLSVSSIRTVSFVVVRKEGEDTVDEKSKRRMSRCTPWKRLCKIFSRKKRSRIHNSNKSVQKVNKRKS